MPKRQRRSLETWVKVKAWNPSWIKATFIVHCEAWTKSQKIFVIHAFFLKEHLTISRRSKSEKVIQMPPSTPIDQWFCTFPFARPPSCILSNFDNLIWFDLDTVARVEENISSLCNLVKHIVISTQQLLIFRPIHFMKPTLTSVFLHHGTSYLVDWGNELFQGSCLLIPLCIWWEPAGFGSEIKQESKF